jgi:DHA2 family multidrug resistance protein
MTRYELVSAVIRALADPSDKSCDMHQVLERSSLSEDDRRRASGSIDDLMIAIAEREAHLITEPLAVSACPANMAQVQSSLTEFGHVAWREYSTVLIGFVRMMMIEGVRRPALKKRIFEVGPTFVTGRLCQYLADASSRGIIAIPDAQLCAEQLMGMFREPLYNALMLNPARHKGASREQVRACVQRFLKGCATTRSRMP